MCIRDRALTDEQVERLLDAIRDLPPYVFVMIGLYAGLRREEILALQWDSVYPVSYTHLVNSLEKKSQPLYDTLAAALGGILLNAEKKQRCV